MRTFTIGGLEIRRLSRWDMVYLICFSLLVLFDAVVTNTHYKFASEIIISFMAFYLTCTSYFGLRFRSIYFSILWLVISIVLINVRFTNITWFALLICIFYHMLRYRFWQIYNREFIPQITARYGVTLKPPGKNIEQKRGSSADKKYMRILLWSGIIILMICLFNVAGTKV